MTRPACTGAKDGATLATSRPVPGLRVVPGAAVIHNRRSEPLERRCPWSQIERCVVSRQVEVIVGGGLAHAATEHRSDRTGRPERSS